jgi:hypothetical protein
MYLAAAPPGFSCRGWLAGSQQQPKGETNMSARALAACSFKLAAEQTVATDHHAPEGEAAEIQFREDLWREYRLEAIKAGLNTAQASEYASALSSEMGLAAGISETASFGRGWFYQSRPRVVRRTFSSGLTKGTHSGRNKATGRTVAAGASILARGFRWWNAGGKS